MVSNAFAKFVMFLSVTMEQLGIRWTDFHTNCFLSIFRNYFNKIQVLLKPDKNNGYLAWTFEVISRWILFSIIVSDKNCRENQNAHFRFSTFFFYKIVTFLWDNAEKYGIAGQATNDNMIWHRRFACWITKAINIRVMPNTSFPRQHLFRERAAVLRCTCIACPVCVVKECGHVEADQTKSVCLDLW